MWFTLFYHYSLSRVPFLVTCMKRENDGTREASPKPKTRRSTGGPLPHSVGLRRGQDNRRVWSHTGPGPYHRRYHWSHRNRRSSQQQRVLSITCFQEGIYKPRGPASKNRQKRQFRRSPHRGSPVCEKPTSNSVNRGVPRHRFRHALGAPTRKVLNAVLSPCRFLWASSLVAGPSSAASRPFEGA